MVNKIDIEYIFKYISYIKYIFNKMLIEDNTFICDVGPLKNLGSVRFIDLEDIERI